MTFTELPLLDYIDSYKEEMDVYITDKDRKLIAVMNIQSNPVFDGSGLYIDHIVLGSVCTFVMLQQDFLYLEYRVRGKNSREVTKEDYDNLYTYIDKDIEDFAESYGIDDEDYLEDFENSMGSGSMNDEHHIIEDLI